MKSALIVVDEQVDFCEGGKLAVAGGDKVCEDTAAYIKENGKYYDLIAFTRDFHDPYGDNEGHFSDNPDYVNSWPRHCEIGTDGVKLHPALRGIKGRLFSKGYQKNDYSGFHGRGCNELLRVYLERNGITNAYIIGIAGDYCVKQTALSAVRYGFYVGFVPHLIASVGGDSATWKMIDEVYQAERASGRY